jgi:hypothetical protein
MKRAKNVLERKQPQRRTRIKKEKKRKESGWPCFFFWASIFQRDKGGHRRKESQRSCSTHSPFSLSLSPDPEMFRLCSAVIYNKKSSSNTAQAHHRRLPSSNSVLIGDAVGNIYHPAAQLKSQTGPNSSREITCFTLNCFYFLVFFRIGQIEPPVNSPGGNGLKDEGK